MNKFLRPLFATLVLALTFGACTKEDLSLPTVRGGEGNHVQFSLNTGSLRAQGDETITRPTPALDREKKINELYAVVFKAGSGVFYKTIKCDLISGEDYKFDSERPGQYYFFLVANPDAGLLQKMQAGPSTKEELGKLIAEQTPGDDNTAANFLMTSDMTSVTTEAATTVSVPTPIKMERVAARFDFYNRVEDFVITKITFKKRYTTTHLFPQVKKMDELTFTEDKEYVPTDGAAGVTATIYGYENDTRGDTYFTLEGTYKGKEIKPQEVRLESMVVKRNHLYNIYLHTPATGGDTDPSTPGQKFGKLPYLITVLDWNQGQELTMSDDNLLKPLYVDFSAHLENAGYMDPYLTHSPKTIYSTTKEATKITLTLGNYMQAGTIELADPAAAAGVTLEEVPGSEQKDPVTGKITKE